MLGSIFQGETALHTGAYNRYLVSQSAQQQRLQSSIIDSASYIDIDGVSNKTQRHCHKRLSNG